MSQKTWSLGSRPIYVSITDFNGDLKCHIRYHTDFDNTRVPTKRGITLNIEEFETLKNYLSEISDELYHLKAKKQQQDAVAPAFFRPASQGSLCFSLPKINA